MGWDGGRDLMILGEKNDYSIKIRRGSETERKKKKTKPFTFEGNMRGLKQSTSRKRSSVSRRKKKKTRGGESDLQALATGSGSCDKNRNEGKGEIHGT
jgi:hypothetical protein